jgi:hypothetical protein
MTTTTTAATSTTTTPVTVAKAIKFVRGEMKVNKSAAESLTLSAQALRASIPAEKLHASRIARAGGLSTKEASSAKAAELEADAVEMDTQAAAHLKANETLTYVLASLLVTQASRKSAIKECERQGLELFPAAEAPSESGSEDDDEPTPSTTAPVAPPVPAVAAPVTRRHSW